MALEIRHSSLNPPRANGTHMKLLFNHIVPLAQNIPNPKICKSPTASGKVVKEEEEQEKKKKEEQEKKKKKKEKKKKRQKHPAYFDTEYVFFGHPFCAYVPSATAPINSLANASKSASVFAFRNLSCSAALYLLIKPAVLVTVTMRPFFAIFGSIWYVK
jgi:hypothetical protein